MIRLPAAARTGLLVLPALLVVGGLFVGGPGLGVAQSLGYQPYLPGWSWSAGAFTGLWADPAARASLGLTVRVAVLSTTVTTVLALGIYPSYADGPWNVAIDHVKERLAAPRQACPLRALASARRRWLNLRS